MRCCLSQLRIRERGYWFPYSTQSQCQLQLAMWSVVPAVKSQDAPVRCFFGLYDPLPEVVEARLVPPFSLMPFPVTNAQSGGSRLRLTVNSLLMVSSSDA